MFKYSMNQRTDRAMIEQHLKIILCKANWHNNLMALIGFP